MEIIETLQNGNFCGYIYYENGGYFGKVIDIDGITIYETPDDITSLGRVKLHTNKELIRISSKKVFNSPK